MYLARTALIGDTFQIELEFRNDLSRVLTKKKHPPSMFQNSSLSKEIQVIFYRFC